MRRSRGPAFTGFGHVDGATAKVLAVERADRGFRSSLIHVREAEAAWPTRVSVADEFNGLDRTMLCEELSELILGCSERQIPDVKRLGQFQSPSPFPLPRSPFASGSV